jgi:3-hydroxyisobutyrate dehydrogenase-like beta-hydroxyacid dehydrogenase
MANLDGGPIRRVGFLGLGIMGMPMAANVARAGFELAVWTRTAEKAQGFAAEHGATAADTPAAAAAGAHALVTMVVDGPEVESVLFGNDGAAAVLADGSLCIDMSTIAPTKSRELGQRLGAEGLQFIDAPVTGSRSKAEDGTLTIMVGGPDDTVGRARPLLDAMGERIVPVGPTGHGSLTKVIANTLTAINAAAIGEALTMVRHGGIDPKAFLEVARAGSSASTALELKAGPMLEGDFEPLFKLEHMLKDVRHCLAEAEALGVTLRLAEVAERLYVEAEKAGHGRDDFAAVVTAAEAASRG